MSTFFSLDLSFLCLIVLKSGGIALYNSIAELIGDLPLLTVLVPVLKYTFPVFREGNLSLDMICCGLLCSMILWI